MDMIRFKSIRPSRRKGEPRRGWLARCLLIGISISLAQINALEAAQAQTINTYKQYTFMQLNYDFKEFYCVSDLWYKESRWSPTAKSKTSSAYGIPQLLNLKSKDPFIQIDKGLIYIKARYSTACNALAFHSKKGYY
jgi:hypothetical protein